MSIVQTVQKSLRIPRETFDDIEKIASETGREFSAIAKDLLAEAVKMRRCPGIVFVNGVRGRKAKIAGTGLDVWEIIATYIVFERKVFFSILAIVLAYLPM
jgi:hypothetical protein